MSNNHFTEWANRNIGGGDSDWRVVKEKQFRLLPGGHQVEVKHCQFCGSTPKPLAEQSFEEMFSWCCEAAEAQSAADREARNICDLCGKFSEKSEPHSECMDYERAVSELESSRFRQAGK